MKKFNWSRFEWDKRRSRALADSGLVAYLRLSGHPGQIWREMSGKCPILFWLSFFDCVSPLDLGYDENFKFVCFWTWTWPSQDFIRLLKAKLHTNPNMVSVAWMIDRRPLIFNSFNSDWDMPLSYLWKVLSCLWSGDRGGLDDRCDTQWAVRLGRTNVVSLGDHQDIPGSTHLKGKPL